MSNPTDQIIKSLRDEPEKWTQTLRTLDHESGVQIWTHHGLDYLRLFHPSREIGFFQGIRLRRAIMRWYQTPLVELSETIYRCLAD